MIIRKFKHKTCHLNGVWDKDFKKILKLLMEYGLSGIEIDHSKSITESMEEVDRLMVINLSI